MILKTQMRLLAFIEGNFQENPILSLRFRIYFQSPKVLGSASIKALSIFRSEFSNLVAVIKNPVAMTFVQIPVL